MKQQSIRSDFSHDNLRKENFSNSILCGFNFFKSKTDLNKFWIFFLITVSFLLAGFSGIASANGVTLTLLLFEVEKPTIAKFLSGFSVILLSAFTLYLVARKGFTIGLGIGVSTLIFSLILCLILSGDINLTGFILFAGIGSTSLFLIGFTSIILTTIITDFVFQVKTFTVISSLVISLFTAVASTKISYSIVVGLISLSGIYVGLISLKKDSKFFWIRDIAVAVATLGGTSFRYSDLTNADFTEAILRCTDFRDANLTNTRWFKSRGFEYARLGNTYLSHPKIQKLVVTLNGQEQNFDSLNLQGVNLQNAKLQSASFIGANLNKANLSYADLSGAKLRQVQLDGADLTGAILTGAYIEDWGITSTTKLAEVKCKCVFMRVPTTDDPSPIRKPDNLNETFADGEFADFIKPYFDTLDLYHSQDIDPRAISIALKNLSANHPEEKIDFVAMERRGNNALNMRFTTTNTANKSDLSHEYFTDYNRIKNELPISIQIMLSEKTAEIRSLKGTIEQFIKTGTYQSIVHANNFQVIQPGANMTENRGININASGNIGDISGLVGGDVSGVVNLGTISGNVTNAINQLPDTTKSDQPSLKELLIQLQQAIQNDGELSDPDKADLLEQVQSLAEAKHVEEPTKKEGLTRKAMKIFSATLKNLPDTAKIVDSCSKLLPLILKVLGFPS